MCRFCCCCLCLCLCHEPRPLGRPAAGATAGAPTHEPEAPALSGPRRYHGEPSDEPWIGDGRARSTPADVERACRLFLVACLAHAALAAAYLLVFRA